MDDVADPLCQKCGDSTVRVKKERRFYSKEILFVCRGRLKPGCDGPPIRRHVARQAKKRSLVVAALLFVCASLDLATLVDVGGVAGNALNALSLVLFAGSIYFVYEYYARRNGAEFRDSHTDSPKIRALGDGNYAEIIQHSSSPQFTNKKVQVFVAGILTPRQFRKRVEVRYELGSRILHQRITIEARIPVGMLEREKKEQGFGPVYFPVLISHKGRLHDSLVMSSGNGEPVHCLSYREYLLLAVRTVRLLIAYAHGVRSPYEVAADEPVFLAATKLVCARFQRGIVVGDLGVGEDWSKPLEVAEASEAGAPDRPDQQTAVQSLRALVKRLHENYVMVAVVHPDPSGRFSIHVEQDVVPSLKLDWKGRAKVTVGARPVDLSVGLELASTCESFHLTVHGRSDLYLGSQELGGCERTLERDDGPAPPHVRLKARLGQSYAHFYSRFFPDSAENERPNLRMQFFERPPGSMLPAAASAFVTFVLVWAVALVTKVQPDPTSDAPAWLLAFPAIAAAWLGIEAPSDRLLEGTFAARLSLGLTVATCIAAAVAFMAHNVFSAERGYSWWKLPGGWEVFWIDDVLWLCIFAVAICNSTGAIYSYLRRTAYFEYLSSRSIDSEVQEHA